jgi:hypothetical protein
MRLKVTALMYCLLIELIQLIQLMDALIGMGSDTDFAIS